MTLDEIESLVARLESSIVTECEYRRGSAKLVLRFGRQQSGTPAPAMFAEPPSFGHDSGKQPGPQPVAVRSNAIGSFYRAHPLRDIPSSFVGEKVTQGQAVGYLEIDSVFSVVPSPVTGTLGQRLLENGEVAAYGQILLEVNP
ncbi:hypothetical protein PQR46_34325 [Paraburkholderia sediminicola]|uniref:acetyl-CoA carboxylase biotin carboxyl carrier protein n=1 Tax=Paraburkholderia TaxID=1822464 RepID=UPI0038B7486D